MSFKPVRFIGGIIFGVIGIILSFRFIQNAYGKFKETSLTFKYIYVIMLIVYIIAVILETVASSVYSSFSIYNIGRTMTAAIAVTSAHTNLYVMLMNMYFRLKSSFIETPFEPKKSMMNIYFVFIQITIINAVLVCVFIS